MQQHLRAIVVLCGILIGGASTTGRAYVIPAFSIPPAAPVPMQPTNIQARSLNVRITFLSAEALRVESDLTLYAPSSGSVKTSLPVRAVEELHVAINGSAVVLRDFPLHCSQATVTPPDCSYQLQIDGIADQELVISTRYLLHTESGRAVSSLYNSTTAPAPPPPDFQSLPRVLLGEARATGVSLSGLSRWAGSPEEVCVSMTGSGIMTWLRDLSPQGWLMPDAKTLSWYWDGILTPMGAVDVVAQYIPERPRAEEDRYYQALDATGQQNLDRWLHLAAIRRFDVPRGMYAEALSQAFALSTQLFYTTPVENDARIFLIPETVAFVRAQGGAPAAQATATQYASYLQTIYDALLLEGQDVQSVTQAMALVKQLADKHHKGTCPALRPWTPTTP